MASVLKPKGARKTWEARWRGPDGEQCSKSGFKLAREARAYGFSQESAKAAGSYIDPRSGRVTFAAFAEEWRLSQGHHRPSTALQVETNLRRHAYPLLGNRPLGSLRPSTLRAWVKAVEGTIAPSTLRLVAGYVSAILSAAVQDDLIAKNPATGLKLPRAEHAEVVPPTVAQVESLIAEVPARYRALVVLAAGTGLRQGECLGLTVDRVDFLKRLVKVDRQLVLLPGSAPVLGPPKTPASNRTVPLPDVVLEALSEHLRAFPANPDAGLVFTNEKGQAIRRNRFSELWRRATKRAGCEGLGFHALRHFYASLLIHHRESVKVVQRRLGHKSATETLDTYGHLWPDSDDATRAAVDSVFMNPVENLLRDEAQRGDIRR